jgi:hypothetical protein
LKEKLIDFDIENVIVFYIKVVDLIFGEASHPHTEYPLILKTPPGVYCYGGGRGTVW